MSVDAGRNGWLHEKSFVAVADTNVESSKVVSRSIRIWTSSGSVSDSVDRSPIRVDLDRRVLALVDGAAVAFDRDRRRIGCSVALTHEEAGRLV